MKHNDIRLDTSFNLAELSLEKQLIMLKSFFKIKSKKSNGNSVNF